MIDGVFGLGPSMGDEEDGRVDASGKTAEGRGGSVGGIAVGGIAAPDDKIDRLDAPTAVLRARGLTQTNGIGVEYPAHTVY